MRGKLPVYTRGKLPVYTRGKLTVYTRGKLTVYTRGKLPVYERYIQHAKYTNYSSHNPPVLCEPGGRRQQTDAKSESKRWQRADQITFARSDQLRCQDKADDDNSAQEESGNKPV